MRTYSDQEIILYCSGLGFCLFFLLVLFFLNVKAWKNKKIINPLSGLYVLSILMGLSDFFWYMIDGLPEWFEFIKVMETVYWVLFPFIAYLWLLYVISENGSAKIKKLWIKLVFLAPILAFSGLAAASYWNGWLFYFDSETLSYTRGVLFFPMVISSFVYMTIASVISVVSVFKTPEIQEKKRYMVQAIFVLPCALFAILNANLDISIPSTYYGICISLFLVYSDSLSRQITRDPLTMISNRYVIDTILNEQIHRQFRGSENLLWLIVCDLDDFKSINDKYGHPVGDRALIQTADALVRATAPYKATVGRLGGDEFVIIVECKDVTVITEITTAIPKALRANCEKEQYNLSLCYGVALYEEGLSAKDLFDAADKHLYDNKAKLPKKRRR